MTMQFHSGRAYCMIIAMSEEDAKIHAAATDGFENGYEVVDENERRCRRFEYVRPLPRLEEAS